MPNSKKFLILQGFPNTTGKHRLEFSLRVLPHKTKDKLIFEIVLPEEDNIDLSIYDVSGRKILTVIKGYLEAGIKRISLKKEIKKGVYFAILKGRKNKVIRKFLVLR